jgi:phosphate transport system substrate-binding protein
MTFALFCPVACLTNVLPEGQMKLLHKSLTSGLVACVLLASIAWACPGCRRSGGAVRVVGSTSVQPFAEMLAEEFHKRNPSLRVEVLGLGSTAGLQAAQNGTADIGTCSRELDEKEKPNFLEPIVIARDGLALIVHRTNTIDNLTLKKVHDLFAGKIGNWNQLGGPDCPVRLITREEGSGTREAFAKLIMGKEHISPTALTYESNGAVRELVNNDPCAIGYMSLGMVKDAPNVKPLKIDGVAPSVDGVRNGTYKLSRPFLFVMKHEPNAATKAYIDFVMSTDGQKMLEDEGLTVLGGRASIASDGVRGMGVPPMGFFASIAAMVGGRTHGRDARATSEARP